MHPFVSPEPCKCFLSSISKNTLVAHTFIPSQKDIHCAVDLGDTDSFLVIGCDGVWDVLTDDEAIATVGAAPSLTTGALMLRLVCFSSFFFDLRMRRL